MKRKALQIGSREFKYKKDAINHYKTILNSYSFGQSLVESDFNDILDLLDYAYPVETVEEIYTDSEEIESTHQGLEIIDIKVSQVQFSTKCFELFFNDDTSQYISYLMLLNDQGYDSDKAFYVACRNSVHDDIRSVKQSYFDQFSIKGQVKCQETGQLSTWLELVVDHRQPHTFSMIVDRFKELNQFDLASLEYKTNEKNMFVFCDGELTDAFRLYHKSKAHLRIVRKECNSSRTGMARLKPTSKDLSVK